MAKVALIILLILLGLGVPVAAALGGLGLALGTLFSDLPLYLAMGEMTWNISSKILLFTIPLFMLLGSIMVQTGMAAPMYNALSQWLSWLPGGLMHTNVGASAMFAATSGSSAATAAVIGQMALPEMQKFKYNKKLFLGSISAGGTLGILIPPSGQMIMFGFLTETSVPRLYVAGIIPGLMIAATFILTTLIACLIVPRWGGEKVKTSWSDRIKGLPDLIPPITIFFVVIGTIYTGFATPTESAALGVVTALIFASFKRRLNWPVMVAIMDNTIQLTGMILLLLIGAFSLNFVLSATGITRSLVGLVNQSGLTPTELILFVCLFYFILGCFMESLAMTVTTVPLVFPIVVSQGWDPIWFGILVMVLVEIAMITPPVGATLFVSHGVRKDGGPITDVFIGSAIFLPALFGFIIFMINFPDFILWLPNLTFN